MRRLYLLEENAFTSHGFMLFLANAATIDMYGERQLTGIRVVHNLAFKVPADADWSADRRILIKPEREIVTIGNSRKRPLERIKTAYHTNLAPELFSASLLSTEPLNANQAPVKLGIIYYISNLTVKNYLKEINTLVARYYRNNLSLEQLIMALSVVKAMNTTIRVDDNGDQTLDLINSRMVETLLNKHDDLSSGRASYQRMVRTSLLPEDAKLNFITWFLIIMGYDSVVYYDNTMVRLPSLIVEN